MVAYKGQSILVRLFENIFVMNKTSENNINSLIQLYACQYNSSWLSQNAENKRKKYCICKGVIFELEYQKPCSKITHPFDYRNASRKQRRDIIVSSSCHTQEMFYTILFLQF